MGIAGYKKLIVWQESHKLAKEIYRETRSFPKEETYGLVSQLRRAALSIPTNIVEGYARKGKNEQRHFLSIALGSAAETEYLIEFSFEMNYFNQKQYEYLSNIRQYVGSLLWRFYEKS